MKLRNKIIIILILLLSQSLYALDISGIVAYPVPFNPQKTKLTINDLAVTLGSHSITLAVFDINGDLVIKRSMSSFPLFWNGRKK